MRKQFERAKKKNPAYSLRAFSRSIGLSPSSTSELLNDKSEKGWEISVDRAIQILDRIDTTAAERRRLLVLMDQQHQLPEEEWKKTNYDLLTDWRYLTVLASFNCEAKDVSVSALSQRLILPEATVEEILLALEKRGLLERKENGEFHRKEESLATIDDISDDMIRESHKVHFDLAKSALKLSVNERDMNVLTFAGSKKSLQLAKQEIRAFLNRLEAIMQMDAENDAVYRLSIQLFPMDARLEQT